MGAGRSRRVSRASSGSPTSPSARTGERNANAYLEDYYAWLGDEVAAMIAGSAAKDAETVQASTSVPTRRPVATS